jgi:hypothetical protein
MAKIGFVVGRLEWRLNPLFYLFFLPEKAVCFIQISISFKGGSIMCLFTNLDLVEIEIGTMPTSIIYRAACRATS